MHIIHVYNECESPYGVGAVAFMVSTYQDDRDQAILQEQTVVSAVLPYQRLSYRLP